MYRLNLRDIPPEGRSYHFTHVTGEITADLKDLLGLEPFEVNFTIKPLGGAYEIDGNLKTQAPLQCSACGWDLPWKVEKKFHEFLVEAGPDQKSTHSVHGSESLNLDSADEGYATYQGDHFAVGEYFHEMIALAEPSYPTCGDNKCPNLSHVKEVMNQLQDEVKKFEQNESPFAVLQKLKPGLKS